MRFVLGSLLALALVATFAQLFLELFIQARKLIEMLCSASGGELALILGALILASGVVAYIFSGRPQSREY